MVSIEIELSIERQMQLRIIQAFLRSPQWVFCL